MESLAKGDREALAREIAKHPHPVLFATLSGAHLYGFASKDSDYDLRGVHCVPAERVLGLDDIDHTVERMYEQDEREIDLVTHDVRKFCSLLLKRNGYVLEQLLSPIVIVTSEFHRALVRLASTIICRNHGYRYRGFAENQWKLVLKDEPLRIKPLLSCLSRAPHGHPLNAYGRGRSESRVLE